MLERILCEFEKLPYDAGIGTGATISMAQAISPAHRKGESCIEPHW